MAKHGKKYQQASAQVQDGLYGLVAGVSLAKDSSYVRFDETLEVAMHLGVDPRHADQMVRGTVVLPHGTGKTKRLLVFASGEKVKEAEDAGAEFVGGKELAEKVQKGWMDFDAVIATPDMMKDVGKIGRVLGPRGLMPNPKTGTVTFEVGKAIQEIRKGRVGYKVDKAGNVHVPIGKVSFQAQHILENARTVFDSIVKAKPSSSKGKYVKSATLSSTMGPGIPLDSVGIAKQIK